LDSKKKIRNKSLAEGYRKGANEDLAIAKEFEQIEDELDGNCDARQHPDLLHCSIRPITN